MDHAIVSHEEFGAWVNGKAVVKNTATTYQLKNTRDAGNELVEELSRPGEVDAGTKRAVGSLDAESQLADREVEQALRRPVAVAVAEHPHVQDQDAGGGEATQAVERIETTAGCAGWWRLGRGHVQTVGHEAERRRRTLRADAERRRAPAPLVVPLPSGASHTP